MKHAIALAALLALPATVALAQPLPAVGAQAQRPLVAAHRGGAMHRPENTLAAFAHAQALGVDILELDLVMTADDQLLVYHDASIHPSICQAPAGSEPVVGPVRGFSAAQLQQLDCGSTVRDIYDVPGYQPVPGERMPDLETVLARFADSDLHFFAETKVPRPVDGVADVDPEQFAARIEALVRQYGLEQRFVLQSSDYRSLDAMRRINPRITTCLLGAHNWEHRDLAGMLAKHDAGCILLRDSVADAAVVDQLQAAGVQVYSEVIDTPAQWQRYVDLGVDVIFTNHPEGAIEFLRSKGLR